MDARTLGICFKRLMLEMKERADIHLQLSDVARKQVCDPMSAFAEAQKREHKNIHANIDKSFKQFQKALAAAGDVCLNLIG